MEFVDVFSILGAFILFFIARESWNLSRVAKRIVDDLESSAQNSKNVDRIASKGLNVCHGMVFDGKNIIADSRLSSSYIKNI